jgi:molybdopterin-guanine dinucleotide biosynthesis protein A
MEWARDALPNAAWLASFACDTPFLPLDLVERLRAAADEAHADMACAKSNGRTHPVFGLWPIARAAELRRALDEGVRKVDAWTEHFKLVEVEFPSAPVDPFFNANAPEDLAEAEALLAQGRLRGEDGRA